MIQSSRVTLVFQDDFKMKHNSSCGAKRLTTNILRFSVKRYGNAWYGRQKRDTLRLHWYLYLSFWTQKERSICAKQILRVRGPTEHLFQLQQELCICPTASHKSIWINLPLATLLVSSSEKKLKGSPTYTIASTSATSLSIWQTHQEDKSISVHFSGWPSLCRGFRHLVRHGCPYSWK